MYTYIKIQYIVAVDAAALPLRVQMSGSSDPLAATLAPLIALPGSIKYGGQFPRKGVRGSERDWGAIREHQGALEVIITSGRINQSYLKSTLIDVATRREDEWHLGPAKRSWGEKMAKRLRLMVRHVKERARKDAKAEVDRPPSSSSSSSPPVPATFPCPRCYLPRAHPWPKGRAR